MQTPSVGRVVHFVATNGDHVPAIICAVKDGDAVHLFIMDADQGKTYFAYTVPLDSRLTPLSWHWPEYVPAKDEVAF